MPQTFHIFSGERHDQPLWVLSVEGQKNAEAAMNKAAEDKPGKYFIWDVNRNCELTSVDTTL